MASRIPVNEGPPLEALTRRLAECPQEFLADPRIAGGGTVHVAAVVSDLIEALGGEPLAGDTVGVLQQPEDANRLRAILVASWLLYDPWFREKRNLWSRAFTFLARGMNDLCQIVQAPLMVTNPDHREELVRLCLKALDLRPEGESDAQAEDRLTTVSTVERQRVIRHAQAAEERARAIRDAMARKAAEEAAAHYSRE
jgi:hypothetical protein